MRVLFTNANIYTLDKTRPNAKALVVENDRIVGVGDEHELAGFKGARRIDLAGKTVVPGFIDAHVHFIGYARSRQELNLAGVSSLKMVKELAAKRAARTKVGEWILGRGWDKNLWGGSFPTRFDLDDMTPHHPTALVSKDGHSLWLNTLALKRLGIDKETEAPAGGDIVRDEDGEPTGILKEKSADETRRIIEKADINKLLPWVKEAIREVHSRGVVGIHDCEGSSALRVFSKLRDSKELCLRVHMMVPDYSLEHLAQLGLGYRFGDKWVHLGHIKVFLDGALGSQTAATFEPYPGGNKRGILVKDHAEFRRIVLRAAGAGFPVAVHAIGGRANRVALDVFAETREAWKGLRQRIEHAQLFAPGDIRRPGELGIIASVQPLHATSDREMAEKYWGSERLRYAYAYRSLLESGAVLALGSDCPVEPLDPLAGIYAAVTRKRPRTDEQPFLAKERLTVEQALRGYTVGACWASGDELTGGTLSVGKLADFAVLSHDILSGDPEQIPETEVEMTVVGGRIVYSEMGYTSQSIDMLE